MLKDWGINTYEGYMKTRNFGKSGDILHYVDSRSSLESITKGGKMYPGEFDRFGEGGVNFTRNRPDEGRGYLAATTGVDDPARIRYFVRIHVSDGLPIETMDGGQTEFHRIYPTNGDSIDVNVLESGWVAPDKGMEYMEPLSREQLDWIGKNDNLVSLFTYVDGKHNNLIRKYDHELEGTPTSHGEARLTFTDKSPEEIRKGFGSRHDMLEGIRKAFDLSGPAGNIYMLEIRLPSEYIEIDGDLKTIYLEPGDKLPVIVDRMHKFTRRLTADPDTNAHITEF